MDTAERIDTSNCGNSSAAIFDAEYTDAPASFTTIYDTPGVLFMSSAINISVSFDAVPLPIAITVTLCFLINFISVAAASAAFDCGGVG
jgi:hypothetical protein